VLLGVLMAIADVFMEHLTDVLEQIRLFFECL